MLVSSVQLKNIKSYGEQTVLLRPGLTAISGENGAGKSTILEAIGYALFGHLDCQLGELMREGCNSAEIRVRFTSRVDDREYEVVRALRLSRSGIASASPRVLDVELGGAISEGLDEVHKFLRRHLGLDSTAIDMGSIFADVVGVPQGRLIADFIDTPRARRQKFDPLLGTEDYRKSYEALRTPLSALDDQLGSKRAGLARFEGRLLDLPEVENNLEGARDAVAKTQGLLDQTKRELHDALKQSAALTAAEREIDQKKADVASADAALQTLLAAAARLREDITKAESAEHAAHSTREGSELYVNTGESLRQYEQRRRELQPREIEFAAAEAAAQHQRNSLAAARQHLQELEGIESSLPEREAAARSQLQITAELEELKEKLGLAQSAAKRSQDLAAALERALGDLSRYRDKADAARDAQGLAARADELEAVVASTAASLAVVAEAVQYVDHSKAELEALQAELVEDRRDLEGLDLRKSSAGRPARILPHFRRALLRAIDRGDRLAAALKARVAAADPAGRRMIEDSLDAARTHLKKARAAQLKAAALEEAEFQSKRTSDQIADLRAEQEKEAAVANQLQPTQAGIGRVQLELQALGTPDPKTRLELAKAEIASRPKVVAAIDAAEGAVADFEAKIAGLQADLEQLRSVRETEAKLRVRFEQLRPLHEEHLRAAALSTRLPELTRRRDENLQAEKEAMRSRLDSETELAALQAAFNPSALQFARELEGELQRRLGELQSLFAQHRSRVAELTEKRDGLHAIQRQSDQLASDIERNQFVRRVLDMIRDALRDAGPEVTKALLAGVSNAANEIYCEIMGNFAQTLSWDQDYGIQLEAGGYRRSFRQLSGGEQITAALAVRLALLRELLHIDVAFLDEPTQNLDAVRRENLAEQIQRISGFSQLLVISHDDTFERHLQSVIHVEKVDGVSRVSAG